MKKIKLIVVCHKNDVPEVRKVLLGTTDIEYEITFLDFSKKMKSKIEEDSLSIISDPPDFVIFFKFHTKTFMSYGKFLMESMGDIKIIYCGSPDIHQHQHARESILRTGILYENKMKDVNTLVHKKLLQSA